jgi:hypothetical protein
MGALMVFDLQPTARYQPAGLYINRGAPKNRGWLEREKKTKQKQGKKNQRKSQRTPSFAFVFRAQIHRLEKKKKKERADTGES